MVVLEADGPGTGQSAGPGRIFRHIHALAPLVGLAAEARRGWLALGERLGAPLLGAQGTLLLGEAGEHAARLAAAAVPHRVLGAAEVAELVPALAPDAGPGLLDPGGGAIDAEAFVRLAARELGGAVVRERVDAVRPSGGGAEVLTGAGRRAAARALVCAGAGTPGLAAAAGLRLPVTETVHRRVSFAVPAGAGPVPCLLERSGRFGMTGYGTPLPGGGFALGTAAADDLPADEAIARTTAYLRRALPGLDPRPLGVVRCASTVLAGHTEAMGLYGDGPVRFFAGGNLFKHVPALGPLLADAMLDDRVAPVIAPPEPASLGPAAGVAER